MTDRFVVYTRVSSQQQGESGLGLESQMTAARDFAAARGADIVETFTEVESGRSTTREELDKALRACRIYNATLLVAKLDRLSRSVSFLKQLQDAGLRFVCCDMPEANKLTVDILISVAEHEVDMIRQRTRAALQARKAQGKKLGGYRENAHKLNDENRAASASKRLADSRRKALDYAPLIDELKESGFTTHRAIAQELTRRGVPTINKKSTWSASQVSRLRSHIEESGAELL